MWIENVFPVICKITESAFHLVFKVPPTILCFIERRVLGYFGGWGGELGYFRTNVEILIPLTNNYAKWIYFFLHILHSLEHFEVVDTFKIVKIREIRSEQQEKKYFLITFLNAVLVIEMIDRFWQKKS